MDKNVLAGLALDESKAFTGIKPFHCSLFSHCYYLKLSYLCFEFRTGTVATHGPRPTLDKKRGWVIRDRSRQKKPRQQQTQIHFTKKKPLLSSWGTWCKMIDPTHELK